MGWFGFDFNGDGNVGFTEHMFTMDMMGFFADENKNIGVDNADGFGSEDDCEFEDMDVQERLDELESSKSEARQKILCKRFSTKSGMVSGKRSELRVNPLSAEL